MNTPTITGEYATIERVSTGVYSMDYAMGDLTKKRLGMPLRTFYEIYGNEHQGKSTLSYYLSGRIPGSLISIADLEGFDPDYLVNCVGASGFNGEIRIVDASDKKGLRPHSDIVQEMITTVLKEEDCNAGILDSVGAYASVFEDSGEIGDANMGRRAKDIAQACRRMSVLSYVENPGAIFVINHVHSVIGGRGHVTPGGKTLKYLAGVNIYLYSKAITTSATGEIIGYEIEGKMEKLKFGGKGRKFGCINLAGYGISPELSAVYDCFRYGLATRGSVVKIGDKSFGYISKLFEAAVEGDKKKFEPFFELLDQKREEEGFIYG